MIRRLTCYLRIPGLRTLRLNQGGDGSNPIVPAKSIVKELFVTFLLMTRTIRTQLGSYPINFFVFVSHE